MFVQNHLKSVQAAKGTASARSLVLSLSEFMLPQGQVLGASLLRIIRSYRKIPMPVSGWNHQLLRSGEIMLQLHSLIPWAAFTLQ